MANNKSNTISLLLGNGNGTFLAQQTLATGNNPQSVAFGDVNGDGKCDLAVVNFSGPSVSVFLGNGNGTFQSQQAFAVAKSPGPLVMGDVNGDGKPDLAVASQSSSSISVLLGNGNGTFQTQQTFGTNSGPYSMVLADTNGDGRPDLVVANVGVQSIYVSLNNANGNFTGQVYTSSHLVFVQSINCTTPAGPTTNATSVSFTVTFNQPVVGVDSTDFALASTGPIAGNLIQVTAVSASVYTVTVSGITGSGSLGLNLVDNGSIRGFGGDSLTQQGAPVNFPTQQFPRVLLLIPWRLVI